MLALVPPAPLARNRLMTKSNRNTVFPNGTRLRELRATLGFTQLELASYLDCSERLIRKAEKSERIDLASLMMFHYFFAKKGISIELEEIKLGHPSTASIATRWFTRCFVGRDVENASKALCPNVQFTLDRVHGSGSFDFEVQLIEALKRLGSFQFKLDKCLAEGEEAILLWSAIGEGSAFAPSSIHPDLAELRGTIWLRIVNHKISHFQDSYSPGEHGFCSQESPTERQTFSRKPASKLSKSTR